MSSVQTQTRGSEANHIRLPTHARQQKTAQENHLFLSTCCSMTDKRAFGVCLGMTWTSVTCYRNGYVSCGACRSHAPTGADPPAAQSIVQCAGTAVPPLNDPVSFFLTYCSSQRPAVDVKLVTQLAPHSCFALVVENM